MKFRMQPTFDLVGTSAKVYFYLREQCQAQRDVIAALRRPTRLAHSTSSSRSIPLIECRLSRSGEFNYPPIGIEERRCFQKCIRRIALEDIAGYSEVISRYLVLVSVRGSHNEDNAFL